MQNESETKQWKSFVVLFFHVFLTFIAFFPNCWLIVNKVIIGFGVIET